MVEEVHPLLGLSDDCVDVGDSRQVLRDWTSQKPDGFHNHSAVEYDERRECLGDFPEVHNHLHSLECVQLKVGAGGIFFYYEPGLVIITKARVRCHSIFHIC